MVGQLIQKKEEEKKIKEAQTANARYWKILACYDDDDDYNFEITPNEPVNSLSMGDEHPDYIPATESDEFIKSSVENLVLILSKFEGASECVVPAREEFTTFSNVLFNDEYEFDSKDDQSFYNEDVPEKIFLNPLFEEEITPMKIDQHHYNAESDLIESLRTHDSSIIISSKIDSLLDEFAGELTLLKSISSGIDETDCDPEEEIRLIERLLYDNSSPRPPKEFVSDNSDDAIESFSLATIPVKDSDSLMEEIDLSFNPDYPIPSSIEDDDDDSERDILILKDLPSNDTISIPEIESFHFDIPLFFRPPAKPPDRPPSFPAFYYMPDDDPWKEQSSHGCFYFPFLSPLINSSMRELGQAQRPKTSASWEAPHAYHILGNLKTLAKGFCTQVFISSASIWESLTPSLLTEEPNNSLSMGDEHLDTISATESDEFIKSSVENLIPIPSESEGIPDNMCDVPFHDNSPALDVSKDQFEDFFYSNDEFSSTDDDSFSIDNVEYVKASPPDSELVSSEVMEIVIPKVGGINDDIILTIKDDILREKLLNINLLIAKIEALNDTPTPSSDFMTKSSSTSLNSLLEETNTFDNSLPEFETFCFDVKEISSGSTTTHSDISLPEYEAFYDDHVKEISGSTTTHSDSSLYDSFIFDLSINHFLLPIGIKPNSGNFTMDVVEDISPTREPRVHNALPTHPTLQLNLEFKLSSGSLFTYVVWIFLHFLLYSIAPQYLLSLGNEDTLFDPGICSYPISSF
nr:hypothetical protein [Tanacetum cinerariifolium]